MANPPQQTLRLPLSPFDAVGPRLYVHKLFIFEFPSAMRLEEATGHLRERVAVCALRWPIITGRVAPVPDRALQKSRLEIFYELPIAADVERDLLTVKEVQPYEMKNSYYQMDLSGALPSDIDMRVLSNVPEWPRPGETYPACAIQANFIPGGLILCFAVHHAVADGGAFTAFIKEFGAGKAFTGFASDGIPAKVESRIPYGLINNRDAKPLTNFPEYNPGNSSNKPPHSKPVTTRILQFSAEKIRSLEKVIGERIRKDFGPEAWASNIAIISALIWTSTVRARESRLDPDDIVKIGIAVNVRSLMKPKLPEEYFGNAIVHTVATTKLRDFFVTDPTESKENNLVGTLAMAAWAIRTAVKNVDSEYVADRLATYSTLEDPTDVGKAYARAIDNGHTGIDFSSWRDQGADIEFNIPGTARAKLDYWRKAWSPNEGAYNILPRKGGSKGDAVWEISLGLSVEDMDTVCKDLGTWLYNVLE